MNAQRKRHEYKVLDVHDNEAEAEMNRYGEQGWRVVSHQPFVASIFRTVLEREIVEPMASETVAAE